MNSTERNTLTIGSERSGVQSGQRTSVSLAVHGRWAQCVRGRMGGMASLLRGVYQGESLVGTSSY